MARFKLVRCLSNPNGLGETPIEMFISSPQQLEDELVVLLKGKPTFIELFAPNGDLFTLGVGGPVASAMFATADMIREGRTTNVAGTVADDVPESVEFDAGGTPTPINRRLLLTSEEVLVIARHFFESGDLHPDFGWD